MNLDFKITVGITISKLNSEQLEELWKLLDGKVNKFHMREVTPIGAAEGFDYMTIEERWNLYKKINEWNGKTRVFLEDPPFCTIDPNLIEKRAGCAAMICLMCVDTDGSIYFCKSNVKTKKESLFRIFHYKPKIKLATISKKLTVLNLP